MKRIWTLIGRTLTMNNEQIEAFVEVLVPIIEERINKKVIKANYVLQAVACSTHMIKW